jgi:hypothetical protein
MPAKPPKARSAAERRERRKKANLSIETVEERIALDDRSPH